MEANELRIGNLVITKNMPVEIEEIRIETVRCCFGEFPINYIEPILITEEWLLKFGFVKKGNRYKLKNFGSFIFFDIIKTFGFYPAGLLSSLCRMDNIKYVHQLQNLYFALTGKELEINMTADEILKKHEDANEMHFHEIDRKWIILAMEEYARVNL